MDNINIQAIIGKHSPLLAAALEHNKPTEINPENVKAAIKEIVEAVIDKCNQKSLLSLTDYHTMKKATVEEYTCGLKNNEPALVIEVDKQSILAVKKRINYE